MKEKGNNKPRGKRSQGTRERISVALKGNKNRAGKTIPLQSRTRRVSVCLPANIFRKCKRLSVEMEIPFSHAVSVCLAAFLGCGVPERIKRRAAREACRERISVPAPGNPEIVFPC